MPEFINQSVRDLAWALSSPPLLSNLSDVCVWPESKWFQQLFEDSLPWLERIDQAPAELETLLAGKKDRRLGKYFETLWYYWLSQHPRYEIIEHNLQIIIDGETLGEMDFILFDKKTGQTLHWEVAVKFYLGVNDTSLMANWHGPNLRDRLDIKVEHLLQRQSRISRQPRVKQWLLERGINIDTCAVVLKGRLYYPWPGEVAWQSSPAVVSPSQCSADHLRSWWLNSAQFERLFDDKQRFMPLINAGWLARIPTASVKKLYFKKDIFETVSNKNMRFPVQLMLCNLCHIRDRVFLVGSEWP